MHTYSIKNPNQMQFVSHTMVEQETSESPTAKRINQTISVPFLWEEKPGTPKPDYWKRVNPIIMQLPIKLIASVPFMWEEKPGTPLPTFLDEPKIMIHQQNKNNNPFYETESDCCHDLDQEQYQASESELGITQQYNKNNPFCDSSSDDEFEDNNNDENEYGLNTPSSPAWETESFASSYAPTEMTTSTLAGSSFLECMFPLMTSQNKPSFLKTNTCTEIVAYGGEVRKVLTLGEMIMMSRRRSYLKRAVQSRDQYNHSTELMMRNGFGCCSIDVGGLNKLKRHLQLKLI